MTIYQTIQGLINKGIEKKLITKQDAIYTTNQLISLLNINTFPNEEVTPMEDSIPNLLADLTHYAIQHEVIEKHDDQQDIFQAKIMNCLLPQPSTINETFWRLYEKSPKEATNYFYQLSKNSNYIQMKQIKKNIHFNVDSAYGALEITINLSKPEKDPEQIIREKELKRDVHYPKCLLCIENEGYIGRVDHPARANHRTIHVPLGDENWYLQYSPYIYYNEHSILLSEHHVPMEINRTTFTQLLMFVQQFPHYFIGSNADLPIVGGSILSHDHYQAGYKTFPMTKAKEDISFPLNHFPNVTAAILDWPMTVIRLTSTHKEALTAAANAILTTWKTYEDREVDIIPYSDTIPHNTITPIARYNKNTFELDLVLRNNRTNEEHPLGIFHPHEDVQHIKKENIGLIEVMGLAVLPGRLLEELTLLKEALVDPTVQVPSIHQPWLNELKAKYPDVLTINTSEQIIRQELGNKFLNVLHDAGVFKRTEAGRKALHRFIHQLNKGG